MKNPFETSIIEKPLSSYDFENSYPEKSCSNAIGLGGNEFSHDLYYQSVSIVRRLIWKNCQEVTELQGCKSAMKDVKNDRLCLESQLYFSRSSSLFWL